MGENTRRANFERYFREVLKGSRSELMRKTGLSKGRITQLFDADQPFGEVSARRLASKLGLAPDFFERETGRARISLTEEEAELLRLWEPLFAEQKQDLLDRLRVEHERAQRTIAEVKARHLDVAVPDGIVERALGLPPAQKELPITGKEPARVKRRR